MSIRSSILCLLALVIGSSPLRADEPPKKIKLAVMLCFDQLRADFLVRWDKLFVEDGFRRLTKHGAWFQNCNYPYAVTYTGSGHASIATGCSPWKHGIVANDWIDRKTGDPVYCAGETRYLHVPKVENPPEDFQAGSPRHLTAPTLADALKKATEGKGKVVALSMKDRAAVLPGGKAPDACFWYDRETGDFISSTYYIDGLPRWVRNFNAKRGVDRWFGRHWNRLRPHLDYSRYVGPDKVKGEGTGTKQGDTFPHSMTGGLDKPGADYYAVMYQSPFGNDLLLDFAKLAIVETKLGQDDVPDLLCLSFSVNDIIGHIWGPDSQEALDVTLRSDLIVRDLLRFLDDRIGAGQYTLTLTADHGVCPLPEVARSRGWIAQRIDEKALLTKANDHLKKTFEAKGDLVPIRVQEGNGYYLDPDWLKNNKSDSAKVATALATFLAEQPGIRRAYTRSQFLAGIPKDDTLGQRLALSFQEDRCGDVQVVLEPYHIFHAKYFVETGTTHGSPYPYDTHVPLIVFGPGVRPGVRHTSVTPLACAPILAQSLGIAPPEKAEVGVPRSLRSQRKKEKGKRKKEKVVSVAPVSR